MIITEFNMKTSLKIYLNVCVYIQTHVYIYMYMHTDVNTLIYMYVLCKYVYKRPLPLKVGIILK